MLTVQNLTKNQLLIGITGDFDAEEAFQSRARFEEIAESWDGDVAIDLSQTHFIDSSGIGAIVFLYKRLASRNQMLEIVNLGGQPLQVIKSLRIDRVIPINGNAERLAS